MVQRFYTSILRDSNRGGGHPTMAEVREDYARLIAARYGADSALRR